MKGYADLTSGCSIAFFSSCLLLAAICFLASASVLPLNMHRNASTWHDSVIAGTSVAFKLVVTPLFRKAERGGPYETLLTGTKSIFFTVLCVVFCSNCNFKHIFTFCVSDLYWQSKKRGGTSRHMWTPHRKRQPHWTLSQRRIAFGSGVKSQLGTEPYHYWV